MKLDLGDIRELRPLIREAVRATLAEIDATERKLGDRLAHPQDEAAVLLGIKPAALRDLRLAGKIRGQLAGKRIVYSRRELLRFLGETENR